MRERNGNRTIIRSLSDAIRGFALISTLLLTSCSLLSDTPDTDVSRDVIERELGDELSAPVENRRHGLQITWQTPSEPVDGFILKYGERPEHLRYEKRLSTEMLLREDDPELGPVFRYTIADVSPSSALYVSIAAFKGERLSEFSEVMRDSSR